MRSKLHIVLCFCLLSICTACASSIESKNIVTIAMDKDSYQFEDKEIGYAIVNNFDGEVTCRDYGYLEKKNDDNWERVPSTKPNPVAWCGTPSLLSQGESKHTLPFLSYNGTLAEGTYRIALAYYLDEEGKYEAVYSSDFSLTGEFPMSEGYPPPANVYLAFDAKVFPESLSEINYKIMNESGGEVFIHPQVTLMLYHNSEWKYFNYVTGQGGEITSTDKEIIRSITAEKLPDGFENCTKIRVIEEIALPMRNVFYAFYEIELA